MLHTACFKGAANLLAIASLSGLLCWVDHSRRTCHAHEHVLGALDNLAVNTQQVGALQRLVCGVDRAAVYELNDFKATHTLWHMPNQACLAMGARSASMARERKVRQGEAGRACKAIAVWP